MNDHTIFLRNQSKERIDKNDDTEKSLIVDPSDNKDQNGQNKNHSECVQSERTQPECVQSERTQLECVQSECTQPDCMQSERTQPECVQSERTQPECAKSDKKTSTTLEELTELLPRQEKTNYVGYLV